MRKVEIGRDSNAKPAPRTITILSYGVSRSAKAANNTTIIFK
jgi:hypothetical protein